ncbi:GAF and ANTAR domain-containing protein [Mycobacterium simiae]|uniref:GAF and ANTAR domain-containing protein n=1 Tax=Mycobacterium simiae TaxID=1784 RepID=UPI003F4D4555
MASSEKKSALVARLGALVNDIGQRSPGTEIGLAELVDSAVKNVPGSQYAGITLVHPEQGISTAAATHRYPVLLDEIQQQLHDGPCVSAAWQHHTVLIDDLELEDRWPRFRRTVVQQTPIRSILSFELFTNRNTTMAALNFHADEPYAFDEDSLETGLIFATHLALGWAALRRDEQFRSALASRDIIGQAKGMIMERYHLDAIQAFELIKRLSQDANTRVIDIATRLIEAENPAPSSRPPQ